MQGKKMHHGGHQLNASTFPLSLVLSLKFLAINDVADGCPFVEDGVEG
jgi:hypothetical protein